MLTRWRKFPSSCSPFLSRPRNRWITSPAFVVRYKVGETLAGLLEIRTFTAEKPVRGLRIAENRRLRLVQLVSQGGGQFAHGGHAVQRRDFIEAPAGAPV